MSGARMDRDSLTQFRERGWALARGFFTADEAAAMSAWCDELAALPEVPGRHMVYGETSRLAQGGRIVQRIENFCLFHPGFDRLARGPLLAAVSALMEKPACLFKDKINYKLPGGGGFEPHQDQQAGWPVYAPMFVTALVSIDRATVENGCLEIADGPRLREMIGPEWQPLTAAETKGLTLQSVPTEPGDVIFFDSFVLHASQPNLSGSARRVLYLTYNRSSDGDHRARYFADKRASFPPDVERLPGKTYKFRV